MGGIARSPLASAVSNAISAVAWKRVDLIHELPVGELIKRTVEGFHRIRREQGERMRAGAV